MKSKFPLIVAAVTLLVILGGIFLFSKPRDSTPIPTPDPTAYLYFWGDGCPHCANVQAFFDTWGKKDQANINKLEVWNNSVNARLMQEKAKDCGIAPSGMGVPFLVTPEGKCISGDEPIIDLFKSI